MEIFLYDVESDYEVTDYEVNLEKALDEFYELSEEDGSFFGLKDSSGNFIQFAWTSENKWLLDIPIEPPKLSLQRYANYDECVGIIKAAYEGKHYSEIQELYRIPVMETTLDEFLARRS